MLIHWIWLCTRPGLTDRSRAELLRHFRDAEEIYFAAPEILGDIPGLGRETAEALEDKQLAEAEKILDACRRERIGILTWQDAAYPGRLKNIPDPPVVLYYKGRLPDFDSSPLIGVVGTRRASAYGLTTAKRMGYQIAQCGGILVSGMAFGIDGVAMSGALTAGAPVVGVLGCGADIVYPLSNRSLFEDVEKHGCILTEFPPGTPPMKWNFPRRNRLISGLSCGVLVVEAPEKSGSLITAAQALEQGRDVFAVPGNLGVASCEGSNRLLREGAILAGSGWDILSEYQSLYPDKVRKNTAVSHLSAYPDEVERAAAQPEKEVAKVAQKTRIPEKSRKKKEKNDKNVIDNGTNPPYSDVNKPKPSLSGDSQLIVDTLASGERLVDDVIAETGLPAAKVLSLLTILELKGIIRRLPGKRVAIK